MRTGINNPVVVAGTHNWERIRDAIKEFGVKPVLNHHIDGDMASSVRAGLAAVPSGTRAILAYPCDHPLVTPGTLAAMDKRSMEQPGSIVIPTYEGRRGHPVLFPRVILEEIKRVPTLRHVVSRHPDEIILLETNDEGTVLDIDTWEDFKRAQAVARERAGT